MQLKNEKKLAIGIILLFSIKTFGQISVKDSTVQVVAYWSKLEKQSTIYLSTIKNWKLKLLSRW